MADDIHLRVQQGIDAATQLSNTAVAVSNGIAFLTGLAKEEIKLGPIAGPIAFFGTLAAMVASIFAATAKLRALAQPVQLRKGKRIPLSGRTHEQGGHRIEGTDIEVERGEWVVNAGSSEQFNNTLDALNQNDPRKAFLSLINEGRIGLPSVILQDLKQPMFNMSASQQGFSEKQLKELTEIMREHLQVTKRTAQKTPDVTINPVGDGWVIEQEGSRTTTRQAIPGKQGYKPR